MSYKDNKFQRRRKWERRKSRGKAKTKQAAKTTQTERFSGAARLRITPKPIPTNTAACATSTPPDCDEMGVAKGVDMAGVYVAGVMFLLMFIGICYGVASAIFG